LSKFVKIINKNFKNKNILNKVKMNKIILFIFIINITSFIGCSKKDDNMDLMPPIAKKIPKELTIHNHTRIDNYYWLNDRKNPEVIKYLNDENDYTDKMLSHTKNLQKTLFNEIKGRMKQTDISVPFKDNDYYYYSRFEEGKEYPIYCRKNSSLEAKEEVLINVNDLATGHDYYNLGDYSISSNNKIIAYSEDIVSRREYTIKIREIYTDKVYSETIPKTSGEIVWANDNKSFFYGKKDLETLRDFQVYKHIIGTDPSKDELVYEEKDETFTVDISKTKSEKYILIGSHSTLSSEIRFLDADKPNGEFKVIQTRTKDVEYGIDHYQDKFYIVTNYKAKNFRLMTTPTSITNIENWTEVIPNRDDVLLEDIEIFNDYLVVEERKEGLTQIRVIDQRTKVEHYLDFGEPVYSAMTGINLDFNTNVLRYSYTSLTTPSSMFDYNMDTKTKTLLKQEEVVGGYNVADYQSERAYATAEDGTKIPISIVYKKGMKKDGKNPTLLYAYGSYGMSMDAYFSVARLSLLDRGFVFAIAHIRGGQEMGRHWYEDGKLLKKKNTFTDFIDCSKYLIAEKYSTNEKLFAMGGSAGGLLMGAILNMRPDLYKGVIAAVPFVDVITTMLDASIPLTTGEYDEWGNPNDKTYYDYMLSYSPYDQVKAQNYPNILVTTGLHDSQVQYWEPAKWVAKLREMKTDKNILLLHTQMKAGHGGKSGRFERIKDTALQYAFILDLAGIKE
jgi:oligopeptidase B